MKKGSKQTEETKRKISKGNKGKRKGIKVSEETKEKLRLAHLGKVVSEETKRKMSEAQIGRKKPNMIGNKNGSGNKGKVLSDETRKKISNSMKGDKHYNWKGGISREHDKIRRSFEYGEWRKAVYKRDNYTCQDCGDRSGKGKKVILNAHHIMSFAKYPKYRFVVEFGHTLCKKCHKELHTRLSNYKSIKLK